MNIRFFAAKLIMLASAVAFCGCSPISVKDAETSVKNTGDILNIGMISPLSGDLKQYGESCRYAAELAVDEINQAGGADGIMFDISFADDEGSSEGAAKAYKELSDKNINTLISSFVYESAIISAEKSKDDGILNIIPNGNINDCGSYENSRSLYYNYTSMGHKLYERISADGYKSIAVLYADDDMVSQLLAEAFKEAETDDCRIIYYECIDNYNEGGALEAQLRKIDSRDADCIFLPTSSEKSAYIMGLIDELDIKAKIIGTDRMFDMGKYVTDKTLIDGVSINLPFIADSDDEIQKKFTEKFLEDNSRLPDFYAAEVYDSIYTLKKAVESANGDTSTSSLIEAIDNVDFEGITGKIRFDDAGEGSVELKMAVLKDGKFTYVKDSEREE